MHFDQVGRSEDVRLEFLVAESSHQGDGSCLLTAREQIGDQPFLLVGLRCIFDPRIVRGLLDEMRPRSVTVAYGAVQPEVAVLGLDTDQGQSLPITEQIVAPKLSGIGMLACRPSFFDYLDAKPKGPPADLPNSQGPNQTSLDDAIARAAEQDDLDRFDIASIDPYIPSMRKETNPFVLRIEEPEDVAAAERALVANACKGRNDLLATYINKPIENFIVQRFARTALTPNQVTFFVNIVAWTATYLFFDGYLLLALLLTFIVSFLDGVDGKLSRVKLCSSKLGGMEHAFDFLFEQSWYFALGLFLWGSYGPTALILPTLIALFDSFAAHCDNAFGKGYPGHALSDFGRIERAFRKIDGRKNTYIVLLLIAILCHQPFFGLAAVAVWSFASAAFYCVRTVKHLLVVDRESAKGIIH